MDLLTAPDDTLLLPRAAAPEYRATCCVGNGPFPFPAAPPVILVCWDAEPEYRAIGVTPDDELARPLAEGTATATAAFDRRAFKSHPAEPEYRETGFVGEDDDDEAAAAGFDPKVAAVPEAFVAAANAPAGAGRFLEATAPAANFPAETADAVPPTDACVLFVRVLLLLLPPPVLRDAGTATVRASAMRAPPPPPSPPAAVVAVFVQTRWPRPLLPAADVPPPRSTGPLVATVTPEEGGGGGGHLAGFGRVAALLAAPARDAPPSTVELVRPTFVHTRWMDLVVLRAAALLIPVGFGVGEGSGRGIFDVGRGCSDPARLRPELPLSATPFPPPLEPFASMLTHTRLFPPAFGARCDAGIALPRAAVTAVAVLFEEEEEVM